MAEVSRKWTPYQYTFNNPIRFIDPDGMIVTAHDKKSKQNIKNTLTKNDAKYVKFNRKGIIKKRRLNRCKSSSGNFLALKELTNSNTVYNFYVASEYKNGKTDSKIPLVGDEENGTRGVTLLPGAEKDPSPDNEVHIYTSNKLSDERQVENTAHEGYGHAYFYELQQKGEDIDPYHHYVPDPNGGSIEVDKKGNIIEIVIPLVDSNEKLDKQIKERESEARKNYKEHKK